MIDENVFRVVYDFAFTLEKGIEYNDAEVGKDKVKSITYHVPRGEGDRHFCDIYYVNGTKIRVFNINKIEWKDDLDLNKNDCLKETCIEIPDSIARKELLEYQVWTLLDGSGKEIAMGFYENSFDEKYPIDDWPGFTIHNRKWVTSQQLNNPSWRKAVNFIIEDRG